MSTNVNNIELNRDYIGKQPYKRVGSCSDCSGRCCNFVAFGLSGGNSSYFRLHGTPVLDKWLNHEYVIIPTQCQQCVHGLCHVFGEKSMPGACQQFPCTPFDDVWRYLKQSGMPCGFDFVDRETGKPWNMRRKKKNAAK